jgi:hypothetical protein
MKSIPLDKCSTIQLQIIAKTMGLDEKRDSFANFIYGDVKGARIEEQVRIALGKMSVVGVDITNPKFLRPVIERAVPATAKSAKSDARH